MTVFHIYKKYFEEKKMKNILIAALLIPFFFAQAQSGQTVYNFRFQDTDNKWRQYTDLKGEKLTIIDFWATWCSPCAKALPKLNELYQKYKDKGVVFIGLNIDSPKNNAKIKPFANAYKISYPVLKDPNSQLAAQLNISSIPTLLIINTKNEIVFRHLGYRSGDENLIEQQLKTLLENQTDE